MANNVQQYRVHGEGVLSFGVGASGALVVLGYSENGIKIAIEKKYRPVHTDPGGSEIPADWQYMGEMATIDFAAISWREDYLRLIRAREFLANGTSLNTDGLAAGRGQLVGQHGIAVAMAIATGNFGEDPWYFPTCFIPQDLFNLGTENMKHGVRIMAWPFIPGNVNSAVGRVCYQRTIP